MFMNSKTSLAQTTLLKSLIQFEKQAVGLFSQPAERKLPWQFGSSGPSSEERLFSNFNGNFGQILEGGAEKLGFADLLLVKYCNRLKGIIASSFKKS